MSVRRCEACGFENDDTRRFCQNCGARLEEAPAPQVHQRNYAASAARKPPTRRPNTAVIALAILTRELVFTAILAAVLAALIQAIRPPDDVPPPASANPSLAEFVAKQMQTAKESPYPRALEIDSEMANTFLATRVQGQGDGGPRFSARFARAYIVPCEGFANFGVEQRLAGLPVYLQIAITPVSDAAGLRGEFTGGSIGRLPIPPPLAPLFSKSFAPVFATLNQPVAWLASASSLDVSPSGARVRWEGDPEQ